MAIGEEELHKHDGILHEKDMKLEQTLICKGYMIRIKAKMTKTRPTKPQNQSPTGLHWSTGTLNSLKKKKNPPWKKDNLIQSVILHYNVQCIIKNYQAD